MRAQITPMTFSADGSKVRRGSQKWQELALARGAITCAMAANQSITINVGALSNAIAVVISRLPQIPMLAVALVMVLRLYLLLLVRVVTVWDLTVQGLAQVLARRIPRKKTANNDRCSQ